MGAGISSINKLRNTLINKINEKKERNETYLNYFLKYSYFQKGQRLISLLEIKKVLELDEEWIDELFQAIFQESKTQINSSSSPSSHSSHSHSSSYHEDAYNFNDFIEFLETGKYPKSHLHLSFNRSISSTSVPSSSPRILHSNSTIYPGVITSLRISHNGVKMTPRREEFESKYESKYESKMYPSNNNIQQNDEDSYYDQSSTKYSSNIQFDDLQEIPVPDYIGESDDLDWIPPQIPSKITRVR